MKKIWKENAKLIVAIFITVVIASGATYAATTMYDSNIVGYDNTTSGLNSNNVQSALDELYGNVAEVILNIKNLIGNSTLTTTNQTLTGAINELDDEIDNLIIINSVTITFDANGIGTFSIPSGYVPVFGWYDKNWELAIHRFGSSNTYCVAHFVNDHNRIITGTYGTGTFIFVKE